MSSTRKACRGQCSDNFPRRPARTTQARVSQMPGELLKEPFRRQWIVPFSVNDSSHGTILWPELKTMLSSTTHWFSLRLHIPILYPSPLATNLYFYFALLQFVSKGAWNLLCLPGRKWCYNAIEWSNLLGISAGWQTQAHRTLHRWCLESFNLRYSLLSTQNCYYSPST